MKGVKGMIRTPLCGSVTGSTTNVIPIFVSTSDTCFGAVVFNNLGPGNVDILKNGSTIGTVTAGNKLVVVLDLLDSLSLSFTAGSTISYKGCICCHTTECCPLTCE